MKRRWLEPITRYNSRMDRIALRDFLVQHFTVIELDALCFKHFADLRNNHLNTEWSPLRYAQKLVELCEGRDLLPQLQELAHDALEKKPALASPSAVKSPNNLPSLPIHYVERSEVKELATKLRQGGHAAIIAGIEGMGGLGKTTLAVAVAMELANDFSDAQLLVRLGAHSIEPVTSTDAMVWVLTKFGRQPSELTGNATELKELYDDTLRGKKCVLILDDARDDAHIAPLLPPVGNVAIVTSRQRLETIDQLLLRPMSRADSIVLLRKICPRLSEEDVDKLANALGDLPIALDVAGGLLKKYETKSVNAYLEELHKLGLKALTSESRRLDVAEIVFESSYRLLSLELQRAFRVLGVIPTVIDEKSLLWLMDEQASEKRLLHELVSTNLLNTIGYELHVAKVTSDETVGRQMSENASSFDERVYFLHDLTRMFAMSKLNESSNESQFLQERLNKLGSMESKHTVGIIQRLRRSRRSADQNQSTNDLLLNPDELTIGFKISYEEAQEIFGDRFDEDD